jgi:uncharacterized membrane protein YccF (DUF307 family)
MAFRGPHAYALRVNAIGNLIWFVLGGFIMGIGWWLAGCAMILSIVGIPWARSCFVIGGFCFFPFGRQAVDRDARGTGTLGTLGNIIWFVLAGWWLAIGHLISAIGCAVTIIGIPFAIQHLKLAGIALAPVGKTIVDAR